MSESKQNFSIEVEGKKAVCPLGEVVGKKMISEGKIPVISCEGGCFRGEIARGSVTYGGKGRAIQSRMPRRNVYSTTFGNGRVGQEG